MSDEKDKEPRASARGASKTSKAKSRGKTEQDASASADQRLTPANKKSKPKGQLGVPGSKDPSRRCTATANRTGKRCGAPAIKGATVCRMHGGALPQVKAKAKERLLALVDPALAALHEVLTNPKADDSTKVRAALGILDRTGHGPGAKLEIGGPNAFEQVAMEALDVDRSHGGGGEPGAAIEPGHTWEDEDTFQRNAQREAWRGLDAEDEAPYTTRFDPYDGNTVPGEVLSDSLLPDPGKHPSGPTEMSGGVTRVRRRPPEAPPVHWEVD